MYCNTQYTHTHTECMAIGRLQPAMPPLRSEALTRSLAIVRSAAIKWNVRHQLIFGSASMQIRQFCRCCCCCCSNTAKSDRGQTVCDLFSLAHRAFVCIPIEYTFPLIPHWVNGGGTVNQVAGFVSLIGARHSEQRPRTQNKPANSM